MQADCEESPRAESIGPVVTTAVVVTALGGLGLVGVVVFAFVVDIEVMDRARREESVPLELEPAVRVNDDGPLVQNPLGVRITVDDDVPVDAPCRVTVPG
ncbi:hypothetical protein C446_15543 [Halobiforma nitratireducens JCM 10879]|uniref:Uncharacterized protein n=1 Tax=Halobiforma nitratireducens JCM 10879 TaxID=1227454 RepID=M0LG16_9EURY|nr:hypothetical protein C446_15543 [Halobiforma nitratireducens JCM 10879]